MSRIPASPMVAAELAAGVDLSTGEIDQGDDAPSMADDNGDPIDATASEPAAELEPLGVDEETYVKNRSRMWVEVNKLWAGHDKTTIDNQRKGLIQIITNKRTASSRPLTSGDWSDLFDALGQLKDGHVELKLRTNGEWALPIKPVRRKAS